MEEVYRRQDVGIYDDLVRRSIENLNDINVLNYLVAEQVGFEPTEPFLVRPISSRLPSTTRPLLHQP